MPTKKKPAPAASAKAPSAKGPHTPVSSLSAAAEAAASIKALASSPPSPGSAPSKPEPATDGEREAVKGYKPIEKTPPEERFTAPDSDDLRDIGEASFGAPPPTAKTVHGADDRIRITNTGAFPWRVHASLSITAADGSMWIGTGWFIGPRTLVTAGHCVFIKNSGVPGRDGWVRRMAVMPGRNGNTLPYGSVTTTSFRAVTGWTSSGDQNFDYGVIILPTPLGNQTGWIGYGVYSDADLKAATGNISGYPGDKPSGQQWYASRRIADVNARKVYYDIDTAGGQSGAAVYRIINGARQAVAIHAYGGAVNNSGTRINTQVYNNLTGWRV